jgi:hypothetical protein
MPEVAPIGEDNVDLGKCDVHEFLPAIEEVFPNDAVLRLESPHGEPLAFLETHASAASRPLYDLPLASAAVPEFQVLAARSAEPEIGMHIVVHHHGRMLLEAYDCGDDTWIAADRPPETVARLRQTSR